MDCALILKIFKPGELLNSDKYRENRKIQANINCTDSNLQELHVEIIYIRKYANSIANVRSGSIRVFSPLFIGYFFIWMRHDK
ncbi:hypothetical protein SAMN05216325_10481 [Nitrosomonas marina]|uniref:Uncharacterized protein n=1 Tax=Nitrosomonas marina TaxID=917 RepID=A0A1H8C9B5_9PROT|nr:hypothetical protein SAMN05216325_10481 [Nitrosomonas marina]